MSATLYYGPDSRSYALNKGEDLGRLIKEFGHPDPMKVDDARAVTRLVGSTPASDQIPVVVVGLCKASPRTQDVLLKTLEEHNLQRVGVVLWVDDLGLVNPTIQSRCLTEWAFEGGAEDPPFLKEATKIVAHLMTQEYAEATHLIRGLKGKEPTLLDAMAFVLKGSTEQRNALWPKLRTLYEKPLTNISFISTVIND